ncbi:hypothetical protein [Sphingopyxis sp. PET50]|uniref:hypothetical protein n=1 Tax=Sphingopyxis sp. PET50 TaxID=2976533 RepID=UPI0021B05225|nr:hypothetical protein [Sphingopyxis sp. PET50]
MLVGTLALSRRAVSLAALLAATAGLAGCDEAQKGFEEGFEKQFVESFVPSCVSSATGSGAPAEIANKVCSCAADELARKHSPSELMKLSPEDAAPAMESCAKKNGLGI